MDEKEVKLTPHEQRALDGWRRDPKAAPVAPQTAARMLQLYLRGYSCHDIRDQEAFSGFTVGAIVHARLDGRWDEAAAELRERLRRSMIDQAFHLGQETARTIHNLLACANVDLNRRAMAYLSGTTKEMPLGVDKVVHFKQLVDLYLAVEEHPTTKAPAEMKPPAQEEGEERDPDELSGLPRDQQLRILALRQRGQVKMPAEA